MDLFQKLNESTAVLAEDKITKLRVSGCVCPVVCVQLCVSS